MTAANTEIPGVHLGKLLAWMDTQQVGAGLVADPHLLAGGTQNVLLRFSRGDDTYVLRRPPLSKRKNSDETMRRDTMGRPDLGTDPELASVAASVRNRDVAEALRATGVTAGAMIRLPDLLTDPQLVARDSYGAVRHDLLSAELPAAARVARFATVPDPEARPAPLAGEQSRQICEDLLGMTADEFEALIAAGVLQEPDTTGVRTSSSMPFVETPSPQRTKGSIR
jgi:crotonobetainyl-CoA:carnitine CoA-transferase CaiB-like acyl-CoA transferase